METAQIAFHLHNISRGLQTSLFCSYSQVCSLFLSYLLFVWWPLLGVKNCVGEFGGGVVLLWKAKLQDAAHLELGSLSRFPKRQLKGPSRGKTLSAHFYPARAYLYTHIVTHCLHHSWPSWAKGDPWLAAQGISRVIWTLLQGRVLNERVALQC